MVYLIEFTEDVVNKQIPSIPMPYKGQIRKAIESRLTVDPVRLGKSLKRTLLGHRRLRVGDYRIIYKIEGNIVKIMKIGHRREVYDGY